NERVRAHLATTREGLELPGERAREPVGPLEDADNRRRRAPGYNAALADAGPAAGTEEDVLLPREPVDQRRGDLAELEREPRRPRRADAAVAGVEPCIVAELGDLIQDDLVRGSAEMLGRRGAEEPVVDGRLQLVGVGQ